MKQRVLAFLKRKKYKAKVEVEQSLIGHLDELRKRLIICGAFFLFFSIISFVFIDKILLYIYNPVGNLVFTKPTEAFASRIKISFLSGLYCSIIIIFYQAMKFISPALEKKEKRHMYWMLPSSYLLFLGGTSLSFFFIFPIGFKFLMSYGTENIQPMISISSYISFLGLFVFSFGFVFQLPIVIVFLSIIGIITPQFLKEKRKFVIIAIFILSAVLTPGTDIFSQFMMAIPLIILFEISILLSKLITKPSKTTQK